MDRNSRSCQLPFTAIKPLQALHNNRWRLFFVMFYGTSAGCGFVPSFPRRNQNSPKHEPVQTENLPVRSGPECSDGEPEGELLGYK